MSQSYGIELSLGRCDNVTHSFHTLTRSCWRKTFSVLKLAISTVLAGVLFASTPSRPPVNAAVSQTLLERAQAGDPAAQYELGAAFETGDGRKADLREAVRWYRLAAAQSEPRAQFSLGSLYATGAFGAPDPQTAAAWYRRAAEGGNKEAQCNLGAMYAQGVGVAKDPEEAARWYGAAARQDDEAAMYNLGSLYYGDFHKPEEAVVWFQRAAERGYSAADVALGFLFVGGHGVPRNVEVAIERLFRAAQKHNSSGLYLLGVLHSQDAMYCRDAPVAFAFFTLAALTGNATAMRAREQLEATMTNDEVRKGQSLAKNWRTGGIPSDFRNHD